MRPRRSRGRRPASSAASARAMRVGGVLLERFNPAAVFASPRRWHCAAVRSARPAGSRADRIDARADRKIAVSVEDVSWRFNDDASHCSRAARCAGRHARCGWTRAASRAPDEVLIEVAYAGVNRPGLRAARRNVSAAAGCIAGAGSRSRRVASWRSARTSRMEHRRRRLRADAGRRLRRVLRHAGGLVPADPRGLVARAGGRRCRRTTSRSGTTCSSAHGLAARARRCSCTAARAASASLRSSSPRRSARP